MYHLIPLVYLFLFKTNLNAGGDDTKCNLWIVSTVMDCSAFAPPFNSPVMFLIVRK